MKHHGYMGQRGEFDEFDVTSDQFDQMMQDAEPVELVVPAKVQGLSAITGYYRPPSSGLYTMSVRASGAVVSSGRSSSWGQPADLHTSSVGVPSRA